jgi:hypothetical protein
VIRNALFLLALALALPARAEEQTEELGASPRWGTFELSLGAYKPNVDAEFGGGVHPWSTVFGDGRGLIFRVDASKSIFTGFGSLDVGIGAGYFQKSGKGLLEDGTASADETTFKMIPLRVSLTYRFDVLALRYGIPLAPYGRFSFDRYQWWVNNGAGNTASFEGKDGSGATNGYSFSGGVAFLLDFLDPGLAREMDRDTGINDTYLFVDFTKSFVSDFHSAKSWDLSDEKVTISGGILFVF